MFFDDDDLKESSEFAKSFAMSSSITTDTDKGFLEVSTQRREIFCSNINDSIKRNFEDPSTPGRPIFSFSVGNFSKKKTLPSKWDDAEKWLVNGSSSSCNNDSPPPPAHHHDNLKQQQQQQLVEYCCKKTTKHNDNIRQHQAEIFPENFRVTDEKITQVIAGFQASVPSDTFIDRPASANVLLKDKFTNETKGAFSTYRYMEPMKEGFVFANNNNIAENSMKGAAKDEVVIVNEIEHRDIGTEMTPLGSSTTSRCHTPFKCSSPARHNTPTDRSGPLAIPDSDSSSRTMVVDVVAHLQDCHLAKLQLGTTTNSTMFDSVNSNWSSMAEEEEEVSKSLRHFEMNNECMKSLYESRACALKDEEKTNRCSRYQREEAKIQAWVNLQNAKAEAESRKLEVKIEKMRYNLEEKLMKRMCIVHRKAEELRDAARLQHCQQMQLHKKKKKKHTSFYSTSTSTSSCGNKLEASCGCFPCTNTHHY